MTLSTILLVKHFQRDQHEISLKKNVCFGAMTVLKLKSKWKEFKFQSFAEVLFRACLQICFEPAKSTCTTSPESWTTQPRRSGLGGWRGSPRKWPRWPFPDCLPNQGLDRWTCRSVEHLKNKQVFHWIWVEELLLQWRSYSRPVEILGRG